jgi:hypothetical protein
MYNIVYSSVVDTPTQIAGKKTTMGIDTWGFISRREYEGGDIKIRELLVLK